MAALGARIDRIAGRDGYADVVRATIDGDTDARGLLVLGHLDTVHPVGTRDGALPIRRDGDRVYGPGILDMKGGMYLAVHAVRQVLAARGGRGLRAKVTFLFIPDEEVGSPSTRAIIEDEACQHDHVLVPEPGMDGRIVTGRHAFLRYTLHVHGRPAHAGGNNRKGASAIRAMARLIETIEGWSDPERGQTYSVGIVHGGTFVNVVPIACHAEVLCVAPDEEAFADVQRRMSSLEAPLLGTRVDVEPGPIRPLFRNPPGTRALWELCSGIARSHGTHVHAGQFGGGSDGNFTGALGIATLDGLGVEGAGPHTHEEHMLVSSLVPRARLFAAMVESLAG
ncbi:MAG: M20/M25/M40 family metallo-hydrolase [Alphaproteobacteria bacterium]|nr:M20/M25/M40 family metallo-hydrolase [Alphaproteobacteria bacterium]